MHSERVVISDVMAESGQGQIAEGSFSFGFESGSSF